MVKDAILKIVSNNLDNYTWPIILLFISVIVIIRLILLYKYKVKLVFYKDLLALISLIYILLLFQVVTFQDVSWSTSNFIPFKEMTRYQFGGRLFYKNVVGNLIMFIPYGFLVSYYLKLNKIIPIILISFFTSFLIESNQSLIGRVFDVDDIILNIVGALVGYLMYRLLKVIVNKLSNILKKDYIFNIMGIALILSILVYFIL